jgi:hypothetical protein
MHSTPTLALNVPKPDYNCREGYLVVSNFPERDPRHGVPIPEGRPGHYDVVFTLSIPGKDVFRDALQIGQAAANGNSVILFPEKVESLQVYLKSPVENVGNIALSHNGAGRLSAATVNVVADSLAAAERTAYDFTTALLSFLTFTCDAGIEIAGYEITERSTGMCKATFGMVGKTKLFALPEGYEELVSTDPARRLLAAYREGMTATNVFYQALSFSKVVEGMSKFRSPSAPSGRFRSLRIPNDAANIPITDELILPLFLPFLGKKFSWVREHFRPLVRNAIAHLDPEQQVLDVDRFEDVAACGRAVPILRYLARCVLADYFSLPIPSGERPNRSVRTNRIRASGRRDIIGANRDRAHGSQGDNGPTY